jgi:hypothetical protein
MSATLTNALNTFPALRRTRRNHGLEHATIHLLSRRVSGVSLSGRSDAGGFILVGNVPTAAVERAVNDALTRMKRGEHGLAIHPNCGTNLLTTGYLTSLVALVGTRGARRTGDVFNRLPTLVVGMMAAVLLSAPLGTWLQKHVTTDGDPGETHVVDVKRHEWGQLVVHRVTTQGG